MSDQVIQLVPFSEPSSDDVRITISPDSSNSMRDHEELNLEELLNEAAASSRDHEELTYEELINKAAASSRVQEALNREKLINEAVARAAASSSEHVRVNSQQETPRQAAATGSEHVRVNIEEGTDRQATATGSEHVRVNIEEGTDRQATATGSEHVRVNIQEGTFRQAAPSSRSLADNIAVIGLIGAISAWLYGILFQLADKMHGSFFSHHRGMAMISGASMVYAAFSGVFLGVIFFLATADPTKTYPKRMRFLWGTYFYAACCGPAVLLMAMIVPSFGYKVLALLGALFTPVGLYIGGYY